MAFHDVQIQRISIFSHRSFAGVLASIEAELGRPDMPTFRRDMAAAQTEQELACVVENALGPSGLMEFIRFDLGGVVHKGTQNSRLKMLRLIAGNPLIMARMVQFVPDAGSYAPVTILIDERQDGIHLSYDRMESLLACYGNMEVLRIAHDLDYKVEHILTSAAG